MNSLKDSMEKMQEKYEAKLDAAAIEKADALKRLRVELSGSQEERDALNAEKAREERIELLSRTVARRLKFGDLASGWSAWIALADARRRRGTTACDWQSAARAGDCDRVV